MTKETGDHNFEYITHNREKLFSSRKHLVGILRGRIKVSGIKDDFFDHSWDDKTLSTLSFGQFLSFKAQHMEYGIRTLAKKVNLSVDEIEKIYDDEIFPWDLGIDTIRQFENVLNIDRQTMYDVIRSHPLSSSALGSRLSHGMIAARSDSTIDHTTRGNELFEAQIVVQKRKEEEKRLQFLDLLKN